MNRNNYINSEMQNIKRVQQSLPVYAWKKRIVEAVKSNAITLIVGQTGSGKTTQIPQYLLEWDEITPISKIVCTQPRTVAAQSVAQRVAEEQGEQTVGYGVVGYHIRLDKKVQENVTKLEYMTEGVLLRKAMSCDNLAAYKVVIIDEAHERTVNADLLMGFLKRMVRDRPNDLRVIIMSATLDTERFKTYFENPPVIQVPGSANPVQHHWCLSPTANYKDLTIQTIIAIHKNGYEYDENTRTDIPDGHILVFLTGQRDIDGVVNEIKNLVKSKEVAPNLQVCPLYSALSSEDRKRAFAEPPKTVRKCVVATNIAETSLTINNVVYVIDCGLSKQKVYSPSKGVEVLGVRGISKASVKQRVGRAGRVKPGVAYHLYTQVGYEQFPNETSPEILRSGLVNEILSMLALGMENPLKFDFIDAPNPMTMARALHILKNLNAIDTKCKITRLGIAMASLPVNARMAKSLITAKKYNCIFEIAAIASMLEIEDRLWWKPREQGKNLWKQKKKAFYHSSGDHLTLLNIYNAWNCIKQQNMQDLRAFCEANYLKKRSLERAEGIKRQIENNLARIMDKNENKYMHNDYNKKQVVFYVNQTNDDKYYENIVKALLSGHFMNIAVKGFGDNYWRFRLLDLDEEHKAIDIIDKAKPHQNSMFHKNNAMNWIIFNEVSISHVTQLKILTAIKPVWLKEIDSNNYYNLHSLAKDNTPISQILKRYI